MDHLLRDLAPVSAPGWSKIETDARQTLSTMLAGRRLVDFKGPLGWGESCVCTGRNEAVISPTQSRVEGVNVGEISVEARIRRVLPLVELRVPFEIRRSELAALDRGARDADFNPVMEAARDIAIVENHLIFFGYAAAGVRGICEATAEPPFTLGDNYENYPELIASARTRLRDRGIDGPYAVALSEQCYTDLTDATKAGYRGAGARSAPRGWTACIDAGTGWRRGAVDAWWRLRAHDRAGFFTWLPQPRCGICPAVYRGECDVLDDFAPCGDPTDRLARGLTAGAHGTHTAPRTKFVARRRGSQMAA
jgi:uncharacterized linocin/CFP29 family protein